MGDKDREVLNAITLIQQDAIAWKRRAKQKYTELMLDAVCSLLESYKEGKMYVWERTTSAEGKATTRDK